MATPSLNSQSGGQSDSQPDRQDVSQLDSQLGAMPKWPLAWRAAGWVALVSLLSLGFMGYFLPSVRLNWEAFAAMCGF